MERISATGCAHTRPVMPTAACKINRAGMKINNPLTAQIDNQGRSGGSHRLQRVNQHIEHAEQRACGQEDAGELYGVGIGACVRRNAPTI